MNEARKPLVAELERRIDTMEQHPDHAFGEFGPVDWWLCVLAGVAVPVLLLVMSAP